MTPDDPYRFLTPVELDDPHSDLRYPQLTSRGEVRFVPEVRDGEQRFFAAEHITILNRSTGQRVLTADDVRLVCCLTDTRLVVTLREFAARGQWVGLGLGMAVAAAVNHRNRKAAARDQAGYEAALHIRLQWVASASARAAVGLMRSEIIALDFKVGQERFGLFLRLVKGGPGAARLASDVLRLTAEHWLRAALPAKLQLTAAERAGFETLRTIALQPAPGETATASTPCYLTLANWSARVFLPEDGSADPGATSDSPTQVRPAAKRPIRYDGVGR